MDRDKFLQVNWIHPEFTNSIVQYRDKKLEAYHGAYNIGLGLGPKKRRKCLIFVIHKAQNINGKYIAGKKWSINKAKMYEKFRNRSRLLQFVRRVYFNEKPENLPNPDEKWALVFDHADTNLRDYVNLHKAKESAFRINLIREIFVALSELHSLDYLLCSATPDHFLIQYREKTTDRICIADINELIKKVETNDDVERQKKFTEDFKQLNFVVIFILTGEWRMTTEGCDNLVSNLALSFITSLNEDKFETIPSLLMHPLFWDAHKLVTFYSKTSDFLNVRKFLNQAFQEIGFEVFGDSKNKESKEYDWKEAVDPNSVIITTMQDMSNNQKGDEKGNEKGKKKGNEKGKKKGKKKWKKKGYTKVYDTTNVIDLIRLIRNVHHHPNQKLKDLLYTDEDIAKHIEKQFPKLTTSVYSLMFGKYSDRLEFKSFFFNA